MSEWQSKWPMIYCGHAYKTNDKLALHKSFLFLSNMFLTTNNVETARNLYTVALEGFTQMDIHCSRANCIIRLGDLAHQQGNVLEALGFWMTACPLFEQSLQVKDVVQIDARLLVSALALGQPGGMLMLRNPSWDVCSNNLVTTQCNIRCHLLMEAGCHSRLEG
jgi:hypothetical protein